MEFLDRISVGAKLKVLAGSLVFIALCLWGCGFWFTRRLAAGAEGMRTALEQVARAGDQTRLAQIAFKDQVQQWKDLLLRGHDPEARAGHRRGFEDKERQVDEELAALRATLAAFQPGLQPAVDRALDQHRALGERYRAALAAWKPGDALAHRTLDGRVKGVDKPMAAAIQALAEGVFLEVRQVELRERAAMAATARWNALANGALLAAGIVLATLASGIIARRILGGLGTVTAGIERMAAGDFSQDVPVRSRDELGRMAADFNRLRAVLRELLAQLRAAGDQVASGSAELGATAGEVAQTAQEVARLSEDQRAGAEETAAAVQEFSGSTREVAGHAQVSGQRLAAMVEAAADGARKGEATVAAMELISRTSADIAGVLGVITEIANQTSLLSLNAAIEAAKAGDQGKGFAVVAGQVRQLAERSAAATSQIAALVAKTRRAMDEGQATVAGTDAALRGLGRDIQAVAGLAREIGAAAEEQDRTAQDLARRTEAASAATGRSAAASQQLTATVDEVNRTADHLARIAEQLAASLARFRTG
jgi:methyl-accepting chemotaxis protein-1 (serine sensor receptor)